MTTAPRSTRRDALRLSALTAAALPLATATTAEAAPNVVGVWRLVEAYALDPEGKKHPHPLGPRGQGIVTLTKEGRMMAVLVDGRPSLPEGTKREYASYCGNYTFDGTTLITKPDASSDPARFTAEQVRKVRFKGKRMILIPPASEVKGVKLTRELVWERISTVSL